MFGWAAPLDPGFSFADLFSKEEQEAGIPGIALAQARAAGSWDDLGSRTRSDGISFWAASSVTLQRTPNEVPIGYRVLTCRLPEFTEFAEGVALNAELARLVAMGRVAANVSHDVKNILTAIRGFAGLLEPDLPVGGVAHHVWFELLKACDRGTTLTSNVLRLGAPESATDRVDLGQVVRESEAILSQVVPATVRFSISVEEDLPSVRGTVSDMEAVLMNLVVNARDAMEGPGSIHMSVARAVVASSEFPQVVLSVVDSGRGMTVEVRERVLERFFTTKGTTGGTGLGLAIVRETVHAAGGTIEIDSEPGRGTRVELAFPPVVTGGFPGRAEVHSRAKAGAGPALRQQPAVLVCCSREVVRDCAADFLRREGYSLMLADPHAAGDWQSGALGADVVVMDLVLRGTTGPKIMADLRARGSTARAIFLSAQEPGADLRVPSVDPVDRVLHGAFSPERMRALVGEIVREDSAGERRAVH
jgi:signal transduction histidine kinase